MIKSASQSSLTNDIKYTSMSVGNLPSSEYLIETVVVGAGGATSVTFSNLGQFANVYQHLQIRYTARSGNSGTANDGLWLRFNNDSGANYAWHRLEGNGSTVTSGAGTGQTWLLMGIAPRNGNTAGLFTGGVCDILDAFETTKNKTIRALHGTTGVYLGSGFRSNTEGITSITLLPDSGQSLVSGCRFSLYGVTA